ncbi:unnamed protein product, partial [Allacma fusca]
KIIAFSSHISIYESCIKCGFNYTVVMLE